MAKIAIDAGHGKFTAGKRCMKSLDPNETREWILNNRVCVPLEEYLKSAGHEALRVDDTTGNTDVSLAERVRRAEVWGADYYISVHHNAGINGGSGGGTVVFAYHGTSGVTTKTQEAIYKHAIAQAGLKGNRSDGTVFRNLYVIRETSMPAALIECGFMDSPTDIKYILDPEWSKKIAYGIALGICEVWGGTVKESSKTEEAAKPVTSSTKVNVTYAVQIQDKDKNGKTYLRTLPAVKNLADYAGLENKKITGIAMKVDKGSIKYQVHEVGGGWLPYVTGYDWNDRDNGYAGNKKPIDAVRVYYNTPSDIIKSTGYKEAKYRISPIGSPSYYDWQLDDKTNDDMDGYAGFFGEAIDKFQVCIK